MPTSEALAAGQGRELRTNVLIGVTGGVALATALLFAFTDWGDGTPAAPSVSFLGLPGGGILLSTGAF